MNENLRDLVLEIKDLFFSFNLKDWALQDINVKVYEKQFVGIIGPNGGGKSTLVKLILGILKPHQGTITIFGKDPKKIRRKIGYFPQIKNVDKDYPITVEDIIQSARFKDGLFNFTGKFHKKVIRRIMKTLDIFEYRNRRISELSGGQRNRVFLARALACEPEILILDEPMAGLDVTLQRSFMKTLQKMNENMTIIIVEHNIQLLEEFVDEFICLNRCVAHGMNMHHNVKHTDHQHAESCLLNQPEGH